LLYQPFLLDFGTCEKHNISATNQTLVLAIVTVLRESQVLHHSPFLIPLSCTPSSAVKGQEGTIQEVERAALRYHPSGGKSCFKVPSKWWKVTPVKLRPVKLRPVKLRPVKSYTVYILY
jgi:hypothetical protein